MQAPVLLEESFDSPVLCCHIHSCHLDAVCCNGVDLPLDGGSGGYPFEPCGIFIESLLGCLSLSPDE